jgi:hypothetical protein
VVAWSYRLAVGRPDGTGEVVLDWETTSYTRTGTPDLTTGSSPGLVLDGVQLVRSLPEDEPWPCQPNPTVLSFQVAAPTASELATALVAGAPVAYRIGQDADSILTEPVGEWWTLADWFTGYVTDVTIEARGGHSVASVTALEWPAALGEVIIGATPWPMEAAATRVGRVMAEVRDTAPELPYEWWYRDGDSPPASYHVGLAAADVDHRTALDVLLEVLRAWVLGTTLDPRDGTFARYRVAARHGTNTEVGNALAAGWNGSDPSGFLDLLTIQGWELQAETVAPDTRPPALFGEVSPGVWGVVMSPLMGWPVASTVPGGEVELPAKWSQRIGGIPNTAVVVVPFTGYTAGQGRYTFRWALPQAQRKPRVRIKREAPIEFSVADDSEYQDGVSATFRLAFLLVPDTINPHTSWGTDELVWRAQGAAYLGWPFQLGALVTVTDVDPAAHPAGTPWIHGQLASYTVRITDGHPVVTFATRAQLRDSIDPAVLQLANIPAGVTLAELDPALTLHDLRLLRNP